MRTTTQVLFYLVAIVLANIGAARFGVWATPVLGFLAIGLDLTMRDALHEKWGAALKRNMTLLILTGSVLSYLLNHSAARVAVASGLAFGVAALIDTITYEIGLRRGWSKSRRVLTSNICSGGTDSIIFPLVAFGCLPIAVMALQWLAKVGGGALWLKILPKEQYEDHLHKTL